MTMLSNRTTKELLLRSKQLEKLIIKESYWFRQVELASEKHLIQKELKKRTTDTGEKK